MQFVLGPCYHDDIRSLTRSIPNFEDEIARAAVGQALHTMKVWADKYIFSHPWERMVEAAYRKYPNPYSTSVNSVDTLERRVASGSLFSHRIFCTLWNPPSIVLKIVGTNPVMRVNEQSMCDLQTRMLTISAKNVNLRSLFTLHETLQYSVNPEDPSTTILHQTAKITVHGVPLLGDLLERLFLHNYTSTVANGRMGIEHVAQKIETETS